MGWGKRHITVVLIPPLLPHRNTPGQSRAGPWGLPGFYCILGQQEGPRSLRAVEEVNGNALGEGRLARPQQLVHAAVLVVAVPAEEEDAISSAHGAVHTIVGQFQQLARVSRRLCQVHAPHAVPCRHSHCHLVLWGPARGPPVLPCTHTWPQHGAGTPTCDDVELCGARAGEGGVCNGDTQLILQSLRVPLHLPVALAREVDGDLGALQRVVKVRDGHVDGHECPWGQGWGRQGHQGWGRPYGDPRLGPAQEGLEVLVGAGRSAVVGGTVPLPPPALVPAATSLQQPPCQV